MVLSPVLWASGSLITISPRTLRSSVLYTPSTYQIIPHLMFLLQSLRSLFRRSKDCQSPSGSSSLDSFLADFVALPSLHPRVLWQLQPSIAVWTFSLVLSPPSISSIRRKTERSSSMTRLAHSPSSSLGRLTSDRTSLPCFKMQSYVCSFQVMPPSCPDSIDRGRSIVSFSYPKEPYRMTH